jgi:hypothetical protein
MKTILTFELKESPINKGEFQIFNNRTQQCASLSLSSLKKIKAKFRANICDRQSFFLRLHSQEQQELLKTMLPKQRLSL